MLFAPALALFVQLSAHRGFLLVGAIDPAVNPGRLGFHARGVASKPEQMAANVHSARREIGRGRLLRFVKQTLPIRGGGLRKSDLHHVQIFAQLLNGLRRSSSLDSLVRRQMLLLENSKKTVSRGVPHDSASPQLTLPIEWHRLQSVRLWLHSAQLKTAHPEVCVTKNSAASALLVRLLG